MRSLGPYTILDELGRGGQGVVYLAEDTRLKRRVALKVLEVSGLSVPEQQLERFRREAEAASKLDHPNICAILEAGQIDGVPYIAMRHIEGRTLAAMIEAAQQPDAAGTDATPCSRDLIHAILARIERVARALHTAHERGLIHRDIKPGNIMITPDGEPVVLDFGLARDELAGDLSLTHSGDLLGTPAYMSPEQLMGQRIPLDRRTDVYSLGATLYECLTLQRPFAAATRAELYQRIMTHEPSSAASHNRAVPADLRVVLETAMEKDRNRRYQTALAFAEDLRRVQQFEPILAKPTSRLLRLRRWTQRHPVHATAVAGLVVALAVAVVLLDRVSRTLAEVRVLALTTASEKAAQTDQALGLLLAREAARAEMRHETFAQAQKMLFECREVRTLRSAASDGRHRSLGLSPDGTKILTAGESGAALWNAADGTLIECFSAPEVLTAKFHPKDPNLIVIGSNDNLARVWQVGRPEPLETYGGTVAPRPGRGHGCGDARFSSDGTLLVTASWDGRAHVWQRGATDPFLTFDCDSNLQFAQFWPGDEDYVLTTHIDGSARLWHIDHPELPVTMYPHGSLQLNGAAIAPDGQYFVTTSLDRRAVLWRRDSDKPVRDFLGHTAAVNCVSINSKWVVTGGRDGELLVFERETGERILTLRGHSAAVKAVTFTSDNTLASGGADGTTRFWDLRLPDAVELREHQQEVLCIAVSSDGKKVATGGRGEVLLWTIGAAGAPRLIEAGSMGSLSSIEFSRADTRFVITDNLVRVFDVATGEHRATLKEERGSRWAVFDADETVLLTSNSLTSNSTARLGVTRWDWVNDRESRLLGPPATPEAVRRVWLSPHDRQKVILVAREACIGDLATGKCGPTFEHPSSVTDAAFSPTDPNLILTGTDDCTAFLWDVAKHLFHKFPKHTGAITSVAFHPDGQRFLTASKDATVRLWRLDGRLLATFVGHQGPVNMAKFTPDGTRMATASSDRTARLWIVDPDELLRITDQRLAGRTFAAADLEPYRALLGARVEALSEPAAK